jgi:membrane peptidoglycan carboxypeptidase
MGLARRGAQSSDLGQRMASSAAALGRAALEQGFLLLRALRFQIEEGRAPSIRPRHLAWKDGRRYRATAARRRRGYASGRSNEPMAAPAALLSMLLVLAVAVGSFVSASALWVKYASDLPDAHTISLLSLPQDSIILDATGQVTLADIHTEGYRHYEQRLADMGKLLPEATIAVEDAKFYNEPGVDITSIVRAAWVDYHDHAAVQGASTITQQLVKLRLIGNKPSIDRKAKEAVLALQVEQDFSKNQILEMYLNTAFYGNNAYGIQAAAKSYFNLPPYQLDLAEASMLAGIPQNPTYNNPLVNWDGARARQHQVLLAMVRNHYISSAQADQAFAEDISEPNHMFRDTNVVLAPGFVAFVVDELKARYGADAPYRDGFMVTTTLNWAMQSQAQQLIAQQVASYQSYGANVHQGAMVGIDPTTGAILSMVGSANPNDNGGQYNFSVWPPRNPGSSMKIFNYTAAIAGSKFTMVTPIVDSPISFPAPPGGTSYKPRNYDGGYHGTCQLQACFLNSLNVPAVKVEVEQGISNVVSMARVMGAPPWRCADPPGCTHYVNDDPVDAYGPSLTLGGYGETPLQMATGASVLADYGVLRQVHSVAAVGNRDGSVIYKSDPAAGAKQVLDPRVAYIMDQIMSDDSNRAMIFGRHSNLTLPDRLVGSKTGTTDDFRDGWTVGFTPALATAFWFGNPDSTPMPRGAEASQVAAPVWHNFMQWATDTVLQEPANDWFSEPAGLLHFFVNGKLQWFLPGTDPSLKQPPLPPGVISSTPKPTPAPTPDPPAPPPPTPPPGPPVPKP